MIVVLLAGLTRGCLCVMSLEAFAIFMCVPATVVFLMKSVSRFCRGRCHVLFTRKNVAQQFGIPICSLNISHVFVYSGVSCMGPPLYPHNNCSRQYR